MTGAPRLEVLDGGLLTTVQDAGRRDWSHVGVPESGAADRWSLAVSNLLVGNDPSDAVLEATLVGPTLAVLAPITVGLAGADLGARIRGGRRLAPGRSHRLVPGEVLEMPGGDGGERTAGCRAYLAVPGGIDVPLVLGSRSTCLAAAFGGLDGRPVQPGDRIDGRAATFLRPELVWPGDDGQGSTRRLRVLAGPDPAPAALDQILAREWRVAAASDRVGVRLDGEPLPADLGGDATTLGVPWGAIQLPADGHPIVLGADHQTTGGYAVVGVVISADFPVLGQLRPGQAVALVRTVRATALAALLEQRDALVAGAAALREAAGWGTLIDAAGG
ncbi:MAG TPA: biotin-dependent carboxyltransferase family protein [Candidatus Limnocylindrales bacterium]